MPAMLTDKHGRVVTRMQSGDRVRYALTDGDMSVTVEHWLGESAKDLDEADALALDTIGSARKDTAAPGARRAARLAAENKGR